MSDADSTVGYARKNKKGSFDDQQVVLIAPGKDARFADVYYDLRDNQIYSGDDPISVSDRTALFRDYPEVKKQVDDLERNPPQRVAIKTSVNGTSKTNGSANPDPPTQEPQPGIFDSFREEIWVWFRSRRDQAQAQRSQRQQAGAQAGAGGSTPPPNGPTTNGTSANPTGPNGPSRGGANPPPSRGAQNNGGGSNIRTEDIRVPNWIVLAIALMAALLIWVVVGMAGGALRQQAEYAIVLFFVTFIVIAIVRWVFEQLFDPHSSGGN